LKKGTSRLGDFIQVHLFFMKPIVFRIAEEVRTRGLTQIRAGELLRITQPRVSALLQGKIDQFRLDSLVDIAHRLGLRVALKVAA
jgi:predicted XRE-type DNA-binding protein